MTNEIVKHHDAEMVKDQRRMLEVFRDGLLNNLANGKKTRLEVLEMLKIRFQEIIKDNGDNLLISMINGQIAMKVHSTLMDGETILIEEIEETMNRLGQNEVMSILREHVSPTILNGLKDFPEKSLQSEVRLNLYLHSIWIWIVAGTFTTVSLGMNNSYKNENLILTSILTFLFLIAGSIALTIKQSGCESHSELLKMFSKNSKNTSVILFPELQKLAQFFAKEDGINKMSEEQFINSVNESAKGLMAVEDFLNSRGLIKEEKSDTAYRGSNVHSFAENPKKIQEYVEYGIKKLKEKKGNRNKSSKKIRIGETEKSEKIRIAIPEEQPVEIETQDRDLQSEISQK